MVPNFPLETNILNNYNKGRKTHTRVCYGYNLMGWDEMHINVKICIGINY